MQDGCKEVFCAWENFYNHFRQSVNRFTFKHELRVFVDFSNKNVNIWFCKYSIQMKNCCQQKP